MEKEDSIVMKSITINAEVRGVHETTVKAEKLVQLLKEAKSLADEIASTDFKFNFDK